MSSRAGLFADIDRKDADLWATYLSEDAVLRFGNGDPVVGRDAARDALAAFYDTIAGLRHEEVERWETPTATIVEAMVTYTRMDGSEVTLPVVTIYRTNDEDLIDDYQVFIDLAPLFAG